MPWGFSPGGPERSGLWQMMKHKIPGTEKLVETVSSFVAEVVELPKYQDSNEFR